MSYTIINADCLEAMRAMPADSVDAVVTDPPAGISFMGRDWDSDKGGRDAWIAWLASVMRECLRVLKPGGHALVWVIPRTSHWAGMALEAAGFEVRDRLSHLFGTGFPKGLRVDNEVFERVKKCLLNANARHVEQISKPLRLMCAEGGGAFVVAAARIPPEGAPCLIIQTGAEEGSCGLTVTSVSQSEAENIASNTTLSWSATSVDDLQQMRTSTIETESSTKIELKTWSFLRSLSMQESTIQDGTIPDGSKWCVCDVTIHSKRDGWKHHNIPVISALGPALRNPLVRLAGTNLALKPACEDWWLARKPLSEKTVAANVQAHGTGALNIDACRIDVSRLDINRRDNPGRIISTGPIYGKESRKERAPTLQQGRWPSNVLLSHSPDCTDSCAPGCPVAELDAQSGVLRNGGQNATSSRKSISVAHGEYAPGDPTRFAGDSGGASRFFYVAKPSRKERDAGCESLPGGKSIHPTVKPIQLMRYLCRLITPPGGTILDPFTGSGTTGCAAVLEGFNFIGIEQSAEYVEIAKARIAHWAATVEDAEPEPEPKREQLSLLGDA